MALSPAFVARNQCAFENREVQRDMYRGINKNESIPYNLGLPIVHYYLLLNQIPVINLLEITHLSSPVHRSTELTVTQNYRSDLNVIPE